MSPAVVGIALLALGVAAPATAVAADYPYSGFFATGLPDEGIADTRLSCAHGFFRQDRDGSFVNYHLDPARYERDGTLRYVQYGSGACLLLDEGRIESCRMAFSTDVSEIGSTYVDVIESIREDAIAISFFDDVESARGYLAGTAPPEDSSLFVRCPGFTDELLAGHLTTEVSPLGLEDRDAVLSPDLDEAARARMQAILDRLLGNP